MALTSVACSECGKPTGYFHDLDSGERVPLEHRVCSKCQSLSEPNTNNMNEGVAHCIDCGSREFQARENGELRRQAVAGTDSTIVINRDEDLSGLWRSHGDVISFCCLNCGSRNLYFEEYIWQDES